MEIEKYYLNFKTQQPINYNGLIIHQPSFNEIMKYGIDIYNRIILIYALTLDCFDILDNKDNISLFDLILTDEYLLNCLSESLYIFTKADEVVLYKANKYIELKFFETQKDYITKKVKKIKEPNQNITKHYYSLFNWLYQKIRKCFNKEDIIEFEYIDVTEEIVDKKEKTFIIDSNNFDDISDIILKINTTKKIIIEKPPENMSERQRDVWEKLQEGRNKDAKKNEIHIYDILNVCEFGGNYHIPIEDICNWSLWRIMNCYKARTEYKNYDDGLQIALVSGDGKIISGKNHWLHQLMIRE